MMLSTKDEDYKELETWFKKEDLSVSR